MNQESRPQKNVKKSRKKRILALSLALILIAGAFAGFFILTRQGDARIVDETGKTAKDPNETNAPPDQTAEGPVPENTLLLSKNVTVFSGEDASVINRSIEEARSTNFGLYLTVKDGTPLKNLGVGDLFYLEGDSSTPLGEPYIGKIQSVNTFGSDPVYLLETPKVDEVFDGMNIDLKDSFTNGNITAVETLPGITYEETNDVAAAVRGNSETPNGTPKAGFSGENGSYQNLVGGRLDGSKTGLVYTAELDLLKAFGIKPENPFKDEYSAAEGERVTVFRTPTGNCYHREECAYLGKPKKSLTLSAAMDEGLTPCHHCKPPVYSDSFEPFLKVKGKFGLGELAFAVDYDWDILNGGGIRNLSFTADAKLVAGIEVTAGFEYKISGKTTEVQTPLKTLKLQGLEEKLFPIVFITYQGGWNVSWGGNQAIRTLTGAVPITVGLIVYIDVNGNITCNASLFFEYEQDLHYRNTVISNSVLVLDSYFEKDEPKWNAGLKFEIKGDLDAQFGAALQLYVFNLNFLELNLASIGNEAEGALNINWSANTNKPTDNALTGYFYDRVYFKALGIRLKLKAKFKLLSFISLSKNIDLEAFLVDETLAEWGTKSSTHFDSGTMNFTTMTAKDADAIYYKEIDGNLYREKDGKREILYGEPFFSICGIDESYLYLLRASDSGLKDLYRVSKETGIEKKLAENVERFLYFDSQKMFYTTDFDPNCILSFDRDKLEEKSFAAFRHAVTYLTKDGDHYYAVEYNDGGVFGPFFGVSCYYHLINSDGVTILDYGSNPSVDKLALHDNGSYYDAAKMVSNGALRNSASDVYWLSKDKSRSVLAEGVSGWRESEAGIFTVLPNDDAFPDAEYRMVLYRAEDGQAVNVTGVQSDQAHFTIEQAKDKSWYYFDQTAEEMILYRLSSDFSQKAEVKRIPLSTVNFSLTTCGTELMDECIYFYSIPNESESQMLYRYDIASF